MSGSAFTTLSDPITLKDFYMRFLVPNKPCLFEKWITSDWPARQKWITVDGQVALDKVLYDAGVPDTHVLSVGDCSRLEFDAHPCVEITVEDYKKYWTSFHLNSDKRLLYLKDWHYFNNNASLAFYKVPEVFRSDWMNEFWSMRTDLNNDDFRFVYVGPKGTWTPLHADVYRSYSWSANVVGQKRWWFFPPGEEEKLRSNDTCSLPVNVCELSLEKLNVKHFVIDQYPGQAIFVPSNWYHQVLNLTDCLSINHNWFNACNVNFVWAHLQDQLKLVEHSTDDVRNTPGWHDQCQVCLRALAGLNFFEFFVILKYILFTRWSRLKVQGTIDSTLALPRGSLAELNQTIDTELRNIQQNETSRFQTIYKRLKEQWLLDSVEMSQSFDGFPKWIYAHDFVSAIDCLRNFSEHSVVQILCLIPSDSPLKSLLDLII